MTATKAAATYLTPDSQSIKKFFNGISGHYDFLNAFLSFGLDHYWRCELVRTVLNFGEHGSILDVGVGTGFSLSRFLARHQFSKAVGCDFSIEMLQKAKMNLNSRAQLAACDFHNFPFENHCFDVVTGSFILRSVQNLNSFFSEVKRVVRPNGKIAFLELTRPKNEIFFKYIYQPYLKFYIPLVGKLIANNQFAYRFLSESIQNFESAGEVKNDLEQVGFKEVTLKVLSFGIATIISARV